jgi:ketosteroid isomerase-like protein
MRMTLVAFLLGGLALPLAAQSNPKDVADVTAVMDAFQAALRSGESAAALRLLADDAVFLESGRIETRAEYAANHLPLDIEFEKTVKSTHKQYRVVVNGNSAWAIGTSDMKGTFEGQPVNIGGAELMVLSREAGGWRIRTIHWSSHRN